MPGAEQAIQVATQRGWEATMLAVVILAMLAAMAALVKWSLNAALHRENSLAGRINGLEDFIQNTLTEMVQGYSKALTENTAAVDALRQALGQRLCLLDIHKQHETLDRLADRLEERRADQMRKADHERDGTPRRGPPQ